jgi:methylmalonyl-CoA mutase C-terminal domain/subunit
VALAENFFAPVIESAFLRQHLSDFFGLDNELPMEAHSTPVRIVLAKAGLDGHDRGVKLVARALRDAGYEVIYTGLRQTPRMVVDAALQEDADLIGLSLHSGAHMTLFPAVMEELRKRDVTDIAVFGGGIIPPDDIAELKRLGVAEIFTPGTPLDDIITWLRERFPNH